MRCLVFAAECIRMSGPSGGEEAAKEVMESLATGFLNAALRGSHSGSSSS